MGCMDVFDILYDNDPAVYREGDTVKGSVKIITTEDVKFKVMKIELLGIAVVCWSNSQISIVAQKDPDVVKGNITKEEYFHKTILLLDKDNNKDLVIRPGEAYFPFECKLPLELPSSFEGRFGQIRYFAKAYIERSSLKSKLVTKKAFTVLSGLDLNFIPEAATKIEICKYKQLGGCFSAGSITLDWAVQHSGYVPGEDIHVSGSVQNDSREVVTSSKVSLVMVIDYKWKKKCRQECREVSSVHKEETRCNEVTVWNDAVHIPPLPATGLGRCRIMNINYRLEFKVVLEGEHLPVKFKKDIYIGTVPICYSEMKSCIAGMFNQPYKPVSTKNGETGSQLSLTRIIAMASSPDDTENTASAPAFTTLEKDGNFGAYQGPDGFCAREDNVLPPTAPTANTLLRPWNNEVFSPLYVEGIWDPVQVAKSSDEDETRGHLSFAPIYMYFGTTKQHT